MARAAKKKGAELRVVGGHGEIGHNSQGAGETLTDEQQQVLFLQHKRKIATAKEKLATANSDLRNLYKQAKADGFLKKEFDFAFELEKDEDEGVIQRRRREAVIAKWLNHPLGTQADLFAEADFTDRRPIKERAFDEGKRAAMEGKECKPSYDDGDGHEGWVEGWHAGAAIVNNQKREQADGERLLRPAANETAGPDEFDTDGDESFLNDDPQSDVEQSQADAGGDEPWPDDAEISEREEPEQL